MTNPLYRVELTASFLERLDAVEEFLTGADAHFAYDDLLALRQYLLGDYLILYTQAESTVYLLSIRHHRQLSFDFARLWHS